MSESVHPEILANTVFHKPLKGVSPIFWSQMCLGSYMCWFAFGIKGQGHSKQVPPKNWLNTISSWIFTYTVIFHRN